ncbi:hypothetical protein [Enteractinococcus fodinae]|uniref:Uncharacterized protein n=1 Tax=Enteractinococcus fodinae TaxID=684663 RepID=A0ABU2B4P3_9MICC|nr:hypothetical protein [Enteractinococcus fodinae]MDR7347379.1 hypothetical protein [Enteractinococcus fodinae]
MTQPWELNNPVPEHPADRARRRRRSVMTSLVALLIVVGLVGTTVMALF